VGVAGTLLADGVREGSDTGASVLVADGVGEVLDVGARVLVPVVKGAVPQAASIPTRSRARLRLKTRFFTRIILFLLCS